MKKNILRDIKKRKNVIHQELEIFVIKTLLKSTKLSIFKRRLLYWYLNHKYHFSLIAKANMRQLCIITGKNRGIFRKWSLSRFQIKKYINMGLLPGAQKRGWS